MNCISNIDELIDNFNNIINESRRHIAGKYTKVVKYSTDMTSSVPHYKGEKICHHKFDFTDKGTRCKYCNTFCLLSEDGEIVSGREITVNAGKIAGYKLIVTQYPLTSTRFGYYEPDILIVDSHVSTINRLLSRQRMINKSCDVSHIISISLLINSNLFYFKTPLLGMWICDNVNIVTYKSNPGSLMDIRFNNKLMLDVLFHVLNISMNETFNHGSPSCNDISFSNEKITLKVGKEDKIINIKMFITPGVYSSFKVNYENRNTFFVGPHSVSEIIEPNWNINHIIGVKNKGQSVSGSPCMEEYNRNILTVFRPSKEIVNYIRLTGINVFPQLNFFLYLTIALLNSSLFNCFCSHQLFEECETIFVNGEEFNTYISLVRENLDSKLSADEIVDLLVRSNISIRSDVMTVFSTIIVKYI